jgi:hypothetical protein
MRFLSRFESALRPRKARCVLQTMRQGWPRLVRMRRVECIERLLTFSSITTPPTRKRQKKADSRVAELERKIDALTATLHAQKAAGPELRHHGAVSQYDTNAPAAPIPDGSYRMGAINHDWSSAGQTRYSDIPPGYGPAQTIQRGPEPKRRKTGDGSSHVNTVSSSAESEAYLTNHSSDHT